MKISKLTSKFQATIPKEIRSKLDLGIGDNVIFEVTDDGLVVVKKAMPFDLEFAQSVCSTLSEWDSEYDDEDFQDLQ